MQKTGLMQNKKALHAVYIGFLCSMSYLAVYFARNILSTSTPQMIESGYTEGYIGQVSSVYFIFYAVGQLINGAIGDRVKARYMISFGLLLAGISNFIFSRVAGSSPDFAQYVYGMTGFFLAMIYAPMMKVVAENTEPIYATRCSLGFTFASFFGSPLAGLVAYVFLWQSVFTISSIALAVMALLVFFFFLLFEKKGIVSYHQYESKEKQGLDIRNLIKRRLVRFTLISIITGVVRTTVVFWMPTYISQYLGFSSEQAAIIFTVSTFIISLMAFVSVLVYELLKRNLNQTMLLMFASATVFFALVYIVKHPVFNIICLVLAIMSSNGAASMLWSRYCPSLRDTGRVSTVTGFLDFVSYIAAAVSSTVFANAVSVIGWGNLILIWLGLMIAGVVTVATIPRNSV
ncbi:MAG: MFS transporter [Peptococcaceae bacterium]|nr:MFS transporter [Peptococcaceae bacterium]